MCWPGAWAVITAVVQPRSNFASKYLAIVFSSIVENTEKAVAHCPTLRVFSLGGAGHLEAGLAFLLAAVGPLMDRELWRLFKIGYCRLIDKR